MIKKCSLLQLTLLLWCKLSNIGLERHHKSHPITQYPNYWVQYLILLGLADTNTQYQYWYTVKHCIDFSTNKNAYSTSLSTLWLL